MFVLADSYEYDWPVTVRVPVDGGVQEQKCTVRYRPLPTDEAEALADEIAKAPKEERRRRTDDLLRKTVVGWGDIIATDRRPIPFSKATLERMLKWPWVQIAFYDGYTESVTGQGALVGNSETPPAGGPEAATS